MTSDELAELAQAEGAAARRRGGRWPPRFEPGGWAGTTVSATMIGAHLSGIRVFATGGIGGVHRGGAQTLDISADLEELARTPVLVVCAGPKSMLDVDLTLEYLETRGVPVVGWQTQRAGRFLRARQRPESCRSVADADEAARLAARTGRWDWRPRLLVAVPVPADAALTRDEADRAIATAIAESEAAGIHGPAATPFVLARVAELTAGRSVAANLALIENKRAWPRPISRSHSRGHDSA